MLATHQKVDWLVVQNEYVTSNIGYRPLAVKYKVSFSTLKARAIREKWVQARNDYHNNVSQMVQKKASDLTSNTCVEQLLTLQKAADNLIHIAHDMIQNLQNKANSIQQEGTSDAEHNKAMKSNANDLKLFTSVIKDMATITRDLFGLPDVIKQHQMDIANEKLAMEREKVSSDTDDHEYTIYFGDPEVEEASG
jgi:hypothetical protein